MNMHIHTSTHTNTRHRQSDDDVSTFSTHLDRTQEEESPTSQSQSQYAPSPTHHATQLRTSLDNYDLGDTLGGYQSLALEGDRDRDRDRGRDREERHHGTLYRLWVLLDERYVLRVARMRHTWLFSPDQGGDINHFAHSLCATSLSAPMYTHSHTPHEHTQYTTHNTPIINP